MDYSKELKTLVSDALGSGKILAASAQNINAWLDEDFLPEWALKSLLELFEKG